MTAGDEAAEEGRDADGCRDGQHEAGPAPWEELDVLLARIEVGLDERGRQLGRGPRGEQELVDALEPRTLLVGEVADELAEVGGLVGHPSSSSSWSARWASAARVRVFTVPSGIPRYSATSDCESPLQ